MANHSLVGVYIADTTRPKPPSPTTIDSIKLEILGGDTLTDPCPLSVSILPINNNNNNNTRFRKVYKFLTGKHPGVRVGKRSNQRQ